MRRTDKNPVPPSRCARWIASALLLILCAVLPAAGPVTAESGTPAILFDRVGPFGGTVRSLLISRHDPDFAFLGTTDGQILTSVDGGRSWRPLHPGIGHRSFVIDTLLEHPQERDRLYAGAWDLRSTGGGLFESRDRGESWSRVALPQPAAAVRGMAVSEGNPARMIVGSLTGVFLTSDGGATWHELRLQAQPFKDVESVAVDAQGKTLLVGTWRLGYRSEDSGRTWVRNGQGMALDSHVFSISVDGSDTRHVYASACTGVYRSTNAGRSWVRLRVRPDQFVIRTHVVYIDPANPRRVYAGTTEGLYVTQDDGRAWKRLTGKNLTVNAIQKDPLNPRRILIGTDEEGVLSSDDDGRNWRTANRGFAGRRISRILPLAEDDGNRLSGLLSDGNNGGFYQFDEDRNEWTQVSSKIRPGEVLSLLALPGNRGRLIGTPQGIYWEKANAREWTRLPGAIGRLSIQDMVLDKERGWVFAGTDSGIYRARSEDLVFQRPVGYRLLPRVSTLVLSPGERGALYAATHMGLLRSRDHGGTWEIISSGLPVDTGVDCLTVNPADPRHLYAGTPVGLFESKDDGLTWHRVRGEGLAGHVPSVVFLDDEGRRVIAADATQARLLLSEDGGFSWAGIEVPEFTSPIRCVAKDPTRPGSVFIGTHSEGIYRLQLRNEPAGSGQP
ncbi:MAG: YCF48-related protein [Acidobacteriota bacterium]